MFKKILIANRGEIACRVMSTCRKLGVASVAVYSEADAAAKHIAMADEAVLIGPAPAAQSYLRGDRIIEAALRSGAQAIHPGYGFLSENPDFVDAVTAAGLIFIGPPSSAIRAMGLKDAAKSLMSASGVPVVPGYHGGVQDAGFLSDQASTIGYPVLIKARAGGGGKGMRLVERPADFRLALDSARREAQSSFGDPDCLIEKYITKPRHIEIQVFADNHGNVVHLFERDCSLQRRHQKVIEEAPAPGMPEDMRDAMGKAAVEAARAIGYSGAGTIEFIADASEGLRADRFWFMEMNTRLQVEHPVTEAITGLDLVEWQLHVAAGEQLPLRQQDITLKGWAMEARIYAEDANNGFLPATGQIEHLVFPSAALFENASLRVDSGVRQFDVITPFYDPMIAKLIAYGPDREKARTRLSQALAECRISGSVTNLGFLSRLIAQDDFRAGSVDTGLIARQMQELTATSKYSELALQLACLASLGLIGTTRESDPWSRYVGWAHWRAPWVFADLEHNGELNSRAIAIVGEGRYQFGEGVDAQDLAILQSDDGEHVVVVGGRRLQFGVVVANDSTTVFLQGETFRFQRPDALATARDDHTGEEDLIAPMPGIITRLHAQKGGIVERGDPLLVMEAMKMEQTLAAPRRASVADILVAVGEQVSQGALLIRLDREEV